jgi:hypothetical protein
MQTFDAQGQAINPVLFITIYREAKKLAPARFMTLRVHPDLYAELYKLADIPESIQMGVTPGPLGKMIMRVCCIKPPLGVGDGVAIEQDLKADPTKMVFEIHGIQELVVENLGAITSQGSVGIS